MREAISTGASVEEAKEKAIQMLGDIGDADVEFEIIDLPEKKVLGLFGGKEAKVRVYVESLDNDLPKTEKKAEKKIEKKADKKNDKTEKKADKKAEKQDKKAEKEAKNDDKPVTYGVKNVDGLIKYVKDILDHMDIGEVTITSTNTAIRKKRASSKGLFSTPAATVKREKRPFRHLRQRLLVRHSARVEISLSNR